MIFLYASFHQHINYAKFNLNFVYLTPYEREVWQIQIIFTCQLIPMIKEKTSNLNVNKKVSLFSDVFLNISHNFISHETIKCDDWDPPQITNSVKKNSSWRILWYMEALLNSSVVELVIVRMIWKYSNTVKLANIVTDDSKQEYYAKIARKLADSKIIEQFLFHSGLFWKKDLTDKKLTWIHPF